MARANTIQALHPTRGGMIAPNELRALAETAAVYGSGSLVLTARQEIILPGLITEAFRPLKQRLAGAPLWPVRDGLPPNIVTTCPAVDAEGSRGWLRDGVFADILAGFQTRPMIPICIGDPGQRQLPVSLGSINYHAAERENLWHIQVALPGGEYAVLAGALRSADLPDATRRIEATLGASPHTINTAALDALQNSLDDLLTDAPYTPPTPLHQYTPLTAQRGRAASAPVAIPALAGRLHCDFLQDLCVWAMRHEFSRFGLTPWKTLVTPALDDAQYRELQRILIQRRVNTEQGPWRSTWYDSTEGMSPARRLRVALTDSCPTDTGFSVGVIGPEDPIPDLHIVVREERAPAGHFRKAPPRYTILLRDGMNARTTTMQCYAQQIDAAHLRHEILRAMERYGDDTPDPAAPREEPRSTARRPALPAWRCSACLTEYRDDLGDPLGDIAAGTAFHALPDDWHCPTCGEERAGFERVATKALQA